MRSRADLRFEIRTQNPPRVTLISADCEAIHPRVLGKMGISPGQAINMLYAQIELRHGLPFPVLAENNSDVLAPIEQVAATWAKLDKTDYSYLAQ